MALGNTGGDLGSFLVRDGKSGDRSLIRKVGVHISPAVENFMLRNFLTGVMRGTKKNGRYPRNGVNLEIKNSILIFTVKSLESLNFSLTRKIA